MKYDVYCIILRSFEIRSESMVGILALWHPCDQAIPRLFFLEFFAGTEIILILLFVCVFLSCPTPAFAWIYTL